MISKFITSICIIALLLANSQLCFLLANDQIIDWNSIDSSKEEVLSAQDLSDQHLEMAQNYLKQGYDDAAIKELSAAIELDPQNADAYDMRAGAYTRAGYNERAISDYNKLIRLCHNDACAYSARGFVYYELGRNDEASADFKKASELNPDMTVAMQGDAPSSAKDVCNIPTPKKTSIKSANLITLANLPQQSNNNFEKPVSQENLKPIQPDKKILYNNIPQNKDEFVNGENLPSTDIETNPVTPATKILFYIPNKVNIAAKNSAKFLTNIDISQTLPKQSAIPLATTTLLYYPSQEISKIQNTSNAFVQSFGENAFIPATEVLLDFPETKILAAQEQATNIAQAFDDAKSISKNAFNSASEVVLYLPKKEMYIIKGLSNLFATVNTVSEIVETKPTIIETVIEQPAPVIKIENIITNTITKNSEKKKITTYVQKRVERGTKFYSEGKFDKAEKEFSRAIRRNPSDPELYLLRADAFLGTNDREKAIADIEETLKIKPEHKVALTKHFELVLAIEKEYRIKILNDSLSFIKIEPKNTKYYKIAANMYFQDSNYFASIIYTILSLKVKTSNKINNLLKPFIINK